MPRTCSFCKTVGDIGYFCYPKEDVLRAECLELAGLPLEKDLKVKISSLKICFRHYEEKDFYFTVGNQLRLRTGKKSNNKISEGIKLTWFSSHQNFFSNKRCFIFKYFLYVIGLSDPLH